MAIFAALQGYELDKNPTKQNACDGRQTTTRDFQGLYKEKVMGHWLSIILLTSNLDLIPRLRTHHKEDHFR